jgi:hypothetical protein
VGITDFKMIWGSDANHIWAHTAQVVVGYYSTGNDQWKRTTGSPSFVSGGLWGADASNVFLTSVMDDIRAWDPTTNDWSTTAIYKIDPGVTYPPEIDGIWASSLNDIYLCGHDDTSPPTEYIFHNTTGSIASGWTPVFSQTNTSLVINTKNAIGGTVGQVYVVGPKGEIMHSSNGTVWNGLNSNVTANLLAVFVLDAQHVYIVGDGGTILFSAGDGMFTKQKIPAAFANARFTGIWAADPDNVFAAGGYLLHGDSTGTWVQQTTGLEVNGVSISAVWGSSARNVYVVGSGAWIAHGK